MEEDAIIKLNKKLHDEICSDDCSLEKIRCLLNEGADPLGAFGEYPDDHLLGEIIYDAANDVKLAERLPQVIQLFYDYGMDIAARNIPDDGDDINPLWDIRFLEDESGLPILKVFLDNGVDCKSVESLVDHIFTDLAFVHEGDIKNDNVLQADIALIKMAMLALSYPHILEGSDYIRRSVSVEKNNVGRLPGFRDWDKFDYQIDCSTCTNIEFGLKGAVVDITDKSTSEKVWSFPIW